MRSNREQEAREERDRLRREGLLPPELEPSGPEWGDRGGHGGKGSFDSGDPYTTNVYVGNVGPGEWHVGGMTRV